MVNRNEKPKKMDTQIVNISLIHSYTLITLLKLAFHSYLFSSIKILQENSQHETRLEESLLKIDPIFTGSVNEATKKTCIIRKATTIHSAMKNIKDNKKPRQIINQKTVGGASNNTENRILSKVVTRRLRKRKSKSIIFCVDPKKKTIKKVSLPKVKKIPNFKGTKIVKQNSKRQMVISPKLQKLRIELVNCANIHAPIVKSKPKVIVSINNPKVYKGLLGNLRTNTHTAKKTKLKMSSKIKKISQNSLSVKNHETSNQNTGN